MYSHRLNQHGGNDNNQDIPPFIRDHGNNELYEVYNTNRKYIFAEDETGELKNCIILPLMTFTEDTGKLEDILQKYITNKQMPTELIFLLE